MGRATLKQKKLPLDYWQTNKLNTNKKEGRDLNYLCFFDVKKTLSTNI